MKINLLSFTFIATLAIHGIGLLHAEPQNADFMFATVEGSSSQLILKLYTGQGGNVIIPDTIGNKPVTQIEDRSFWNRADVTSVTIGTNVSTIHSRAFWFCTGLTRLEIPNSTTTIGECAFDDCVQLQSFILGDQNPVFICKDGVLFSKEGRTLIRCPEGKRGNYIVPDGVETIAAGAFRGCSQLQSITLPTSVKRIEKRAFLSCCKLTELTLPPKLESIGDYAFTDCSHITKLLIPATVRRVGEDAFSWTNNLKEICFEGDEPEAPKRIIGHFVPNVPTVHYKAGTKGWNSPSWRSMRALPEP